MGCSEVPDKVTIAINEFKKNLIVWAQNQATGYRVQASIGHTKRHHDQQTAKAEVMDFVAKYLQGLETKG